MLGRSVVWETARKSDGGVCRIVKKPCDGVTGKKFGRVFLFRNRFWIKWEKMKQVRRWDVLQSVSC